MTFIARLDSKGRILIPKIVREKLGISGEDRVLVTVRVNSARVV